MIIRFEPQISLCERMYWIHLAQVVMQCWAVVDGAQTVPDVRNFITHSQPYAS